MTCSSHSCNSWILGVSVVYGGEDVIPTPLLLSHFILLNSFRSLLMCMLDIQLYFNSLVPLISLFDVYHDVI